MKNTVTASTDDVSNVALITTEATPKRGRRRTLLGAGILAAVTAGGLVAFAPSALAAPAPISSLSSSSCPTDMQSGEDDGCVTELQDLLNAQDGAGLSVDGDFGPATQSAVETFQSDHGLSVDGIVGPDTKAALQPSSGGSTGGGSSAIVSYATDIENGDAESGWGGGSVQYVWGGGHMSAAGPSTGTCVGDPQSLSCDNPSAVGIDCSGFARWVYDLAFGSDVLGSGNTTSEMDELTATSSPAPCDLVFFGSDASSPDHVGIYIGNSQMINAYDTGTNVETDSVSRGGTLIGYYHYSG